jgi:cytochrome d ubiquinol oxidase subunit II
MTLATLLAGVIVVALNAYVVLAGADFGGGVWDLLAGGPRRERQRELIAHAIGPVWEANHVWLILAIVLLFTCFPPAFARLAITLHVPLTLMLVGIVLRGSAFTFRSYGGEGDRMGRRWGRVFAAASLVTPVLLGVSLGAIAAGGVGGVGGVGGAARAAPGFYAGYVAPWLTPFAFAVGFFTLTCFAFLAAVYLTLEAGDAPLREDFRRRAIAAGVAVFVAAGLALLLSHGGAPRVRAGLVLAPWAPALHLATGVAAVSAFAALFARRYRVARVAAALQVSLIVWGWAFGQYPYLIPPDVTIAAAAAPDVTLRLIVGALAAGAAVLFPSLYYLFRVFKGGRRPSVVSHQSSATLGGPAPRSGPTR